MPTEGGEAGPAAISTHPQLTNCPTPANQEPQELWEGKRAAVANGAVAPPLRQRHSSGHRSCCCSSIPLARAVVISGLHLPSPVHARLRLLGETDRGEARRGTKKKGKNCWCLAHPSFFLTLLSQCRGAASVTPSLL